MSSFHAIHIPLFLVMISGCTAGCDLFNRIRENGVIDNRRFSVFQMFSGKTCRLTDASEDKSVHLNCENLAKFTTAKSEACIEAIRNGAFVPAKAFSGTLYSHELVS